MCSVSELIRDVKIAICTSGEPESFSSRRYSPINSRLRSFVIMGCCDSFAPGHLAPSFAAENLLYCYPWPVFAETKPTLLPTDQRAKCTRKAGIYKGMIAPSSQ